MPNSDHFYRHSSAQLATFQAEIFLHPTVHLLIRYDRLSHLQVRFLGVLRPLAGFMTR